MNLAEFKPRSTSRLAIVDILTFENPIKWAAAARQISFEQRRFDRSPRADEHRNRLQGMARHRPLIVDQLQAAVGFECDRDSQRFQDAIMLRRSLRLVEI